MSRIAYLIIPVFIVTLAWSQEPSKAFYRIKDRADFHYEDFHFPKAIKLYNKALDEYDSDSVKLRIADSYRQMNQMPAAEEWYRKALSNTTTLSEADMLNYGQVLSANGNYDSAAMVFEKYQHKESWVNEQAEALRNVERFYVNEIAFDILEAYFNSKEKDFSPAFLGDDVVFVSGRKSAGLMKPEYKWDGSNFLDLFVVKDGGVPEKIQRKINTRMHEGPPVYYAGGEKMIFTRNNYLAQNAKSSEEGVNMLKLYFAELKDEEKWGKPSEFPFNSDNYSTGHPAVTSDGNVLFFASDMPGGFGGVDIWKSEFKNGKWQTPTNLGSRFNTPEDEMFPFLHNDSTLYFASNGLEGLGGLDLFRLDLSNRVAKPRNLGFPLNTKGDDFGIALKDGESHGYFSSNREGGTGDDDIYNVTIYDFIIKVNLIDSLTREPLLGNIVVDELLPPNITEIVNEKDGISVLFRALKGSNFVAKGVASGYLPGNISIATQKESDDITWLTYDLPLLPEKAERADLLVVKNNELVSQLFYKTSDAQYELHNGLDIASLQDELTEKSYAIGETVILENVYYDFDKYNIRKDASETLDEIVAFLSENPEAKIDLASHTDIRGSLSYNERLAQNRAQSAMNYLIDHGVSADRIAVTSFGETQTFNDCKGNCNEQAHQINRRTEIRIRF